MDAQSTPASPALGEMSAAQYWALSRVLQLLAATAEALAIHRQVWLNYYYKYNNDKHTLRSRATYRICKSAICKR